MLEGIINPPKAFTFVYNETGADVTWVLVTNPLAARWYSFWFGLRTFFRFDPSRIITQTFYRRERFWYANMIRNGFRKDAFAMRNRLVEDYKRQRDEIIKHGKKL